MNKETAGRLIEENLTNIFAWSMSKLYNKSEAEDLARDIICAVLESADRLKNDERQSQALRRHILRMRSRYCLIMNFWRNPATSIRPI